MATATPWPRPTHASTGGSSSWPTTATLEQIWRSLEPFSRTYLTLVGARRRPGLVGRRCTSRSWRRSSAATSTASCDALERHFEEVSDNMARRWPDDDAPAIGGHRETERNA